MGHKQAQTPVQTYDLADNDIHSQVFDRPSPALASQTHIQVGIQRCRYFTREETQACCDKHPGAGPIYNAQEGGYACQVDKGTGDWD